MRFLLSGRRKKDSKHTSRTETEKTFQKTRRGKFTPFQVLVDFRGQKWGKLHCYQASTLCTSWPASPGNLHVTAASCHRRRGLVSQRKFRHAAIINLIKLGLVQQKNSVIFCGQIPYQQIFRKHFCLHTWHLLHVGHGSSQYISFLAKHCIFTVDTNYSPEGRGDWFSA